MNIQSTRNQYDTIVLGLGAMGSGIAYQLARSGQRVLGLDRYHPPHVQGSSHGQSRVIRQAYGDDPRYVPFIHRTFAGWHELERLSGETLLVKSGLLLMGTPDSELIISTTKSVQQHGVECEYLERAEISRRWPVLQTDSDMCGVFEPSGGILRVETCMETLLTEATNHGATLHFNEPVETWQANNGRVEIHTSRTTYHARHLVIAAGPWCSPVLADLNLPLWIERHVQLWFQPKSQPQRFAPDCCPIFAWQHDDNGATFYGFPDLGQGIKVAHHHSGQSTDPDTLNRALDDGDLADVRQLLQRFVPDANGDLLNHDVCMYTNTPDLNFLVDFHPQHPEVLIVGGCSGHGFKFAPVMGEIARDLLTGKPMETGREMFHLNRFGTPGPSA